MSLLLFLAFISIVVAEFYCFYLIIIDIPHNLDRILVYKEIPVIFSIVTLYLTFKQYVIFYASKSNQKCDRIQVIRVYVLPYTTFYKIFL